MSVTFDQQQKTLTLEMDSFGYNSFERWQCIGALMAHELNDAHANSFKVNVNSDGCKLRSEWSYNFNDASKKEILIENLKNIIFSFYGSTFALSRTASQENAQTFYKRESEDIRNYKGNRDTFTVADEDIKKLNKFEVKKLKAGSDIDKDAVGACQHRPNRLVWLKEEEFFKKVKAALLKNNYDGCACTSIIHEIGKAFQSAGVSKYNRQQIGVIQQGVLYFVKTAKTFPSRDIVKFIIWDCSSAHLNKRINFEESNIAKLRDCVDDNKIKALAKNSALQIYKERDKWLKSNPKENIKDCPYPSFEMMSKLENVTEIARELNQVTLCEYRARAKLLREGKKGSVPFSDILEQMFKPDEVEKIMGVLNNSK